MTVSVTVAERMAWARRSCDSLVIICANPLPSLPSMLEAGIRTLSKNNSDVSCAFMPSFSRFRPRLKPGRSLSTMNRVTPFAPAWLSVLVASTMKSQSWPLEMKTFWPLITKSSPSREARVRIALRSLPGRGLGHAERADGFARHHPGQPFALLRLAAERQQIGRDEVGMDEKAGAARAGAPEFLEHDHVEEIVEAHAAIFLGHGAAQEAGGASLQPEVPRNNAVLFPLGVEGHALAVH